MILELEAKLFGLTLADVRGLVYQFCENNKIQHQFNEENKLAEDWTAAFMKRHPRLSIRKPEGTSIFRASGFNKEKVQRFYDVLEGVIFKDGVQIVPDGNIYNVDESGYTVCRKPVEIVAERGMRTVATLTSAERGKTVTSVCCISASGQYVPPMFIFPRKRLNPEVLE